MITDDYHNPIQQWNMSLTIMKYVVISTNSEKQGKTKSLKTGLRFETTCPCYYERVSAV